MLCRAKCVACASSVLLLALASPGLQAQVRLPHVLADHMVLQRNAPIHVWGWAEPGNAIAVTLQQQGSAKGAKHLAANAVTDKLGQWSVYLPALPASGPYDMAVQGSGSTTTLHDVMVGDLWIASGQSNMEMPLAGFGADTPVKDSAKEIAAANHPELRLMVVPKTGRAFPQDDVNAAWTQCTPETAKNFSAVAYFFGREIAAKEHVTVGLIDTTWGGTPAEAWTSFEAFGNPALAPVWAQWSRFVDDETTEAAAMAANQREDDRRRSAGQQPLPHGFHPNPDSYRPASLYNGMIAPFTPLSIRGVIWYQGETNSRLDRSVVYHQLFRSMILDWRMHFAQGSFPFLYAQISSYRSTPQEAWGVLRDAQRRTLDVANTAMAVTLDVGTPGNVHPPDKQTVGHRLALAAEALSYGARVDYAGPLFARADAEGDHMRIGFEDRTAKLECRGGSCTGFEIAGADHKFVPADATVDNATVVVHSSQVTEPQYVRYAWPNAPVANMQDTSGLPASTFTSEPEITEAGPRPTALTHD